MSKRLFSILAAGLSLLLFAVSVSSAREIVMVFGAGYPPFYMDGKTDGTDNNLDKGMLIDFLREFEKSHPEYTIRKVRLPRMRMDQWMREGRAHSFCLNSPLFVRERTGDHYAFSETLWRTGDYVAVRHDSRLSYARPEDLAGKRVGIVFGNGYGPLDSLISSGHIPVQKVYKQSQLAGLLEVGRIEAYPANRHVDVYLWKMEGYGPGRFRLLEPPLYEFDLAVQVCKGQEDFLEALNAFILEARENGLLESITEYYLGTN